MVRLDRFVSSAAAFKLKTAPRKAQPDTAGAGSFQKLFGTPAPAQAAAAKAAPAQPRPAAAAANTAAAAPTAESVFGESPWVAAPGGSGPMGPFGFNPIYFATETTAQKVAAMLGGQVVASNAILNTGGPLSQQQPNLMVQLASGRMVNAGLVAAFFTHGYPQSYIDRLIAAEVSGTNV